MEEEEEEEEEEVEQEGRGVAASKSSVQLNECHALPTHPPTHIRFYASGLCRNGTRCTFLHDKHPEPTSLHQAVST